MGCLAPFGRFINIGKADVIANSSLPMASFAKNVNFASVDLHYILLTNPKLTRQLVEKTLSLTTDPTVGGPLPLHLFPVSQTEKAFRYIQSSKNSGRILVTIDEPLTQRSAWRFDPHASYIIAGGLGGLGRTIIRWMATRGLRNVIIPSRSGASSPIAKELVSTLESKGIKVVTPLCDCSNMPPIRGCMSLSMVLQDALFDNMKHAQWTLTSRSKVQTSWNLHTLLPHDLDFFIMFSSLGGVYGTASQSIYNAGNTFQDALARLRANVGGFGTSVSIDLGWMKSVGIVSERLDYRRTREYIRDMKPIDTEGLLAALEHYCDPSLPPPDADHSQIIVGMTTPQDLNARGENIPLHLKRPLFAPFDVVWSNANAARASPKALYQMNLSHQFQEADNFQECSEIVVKKIRNKLPDALAKELEDIDPGVNLSGHGVDSLMAMELRNTISYEFKVSVAVFEIMDAKDLYGVGMLVAQKSL
ncbi:KR-domain-containing protein [Bimuria novae-zelandiae CBS 107.79]|uniref:KR-domain-containing protein n=1 Tax=Bimuria novae-zelandiae CBS 107.79 TaxID=1447943 RepID=A0A6A5UKA0_9PLEO|nr:KR-domain-containing protein [Bimuria novae-zelandiae CBS 107.79]